MGFSIGCGPRNELGCARNFSTGNIRFRSKFQPFWRYRVWRFGDQYAYGNVYQAQYYIEPANTTDPTALVPVGPVSGFLGSSSTDVANGAGYWEGNGNAAITTSFAGGATVTRQLRAWKGGLGTTYAGSSIRAASVLLQVVLGNAGSPPTPASSITTMPNISFGPEPATIALGVIGVGAFFVRRRK